MRERCQLVYDYVKEGKSKYLILHEDKIDEAADYVYDLMKRDYPDLSLIPPHSRWRHYPDECINELIRGKEKPWKTLVDLFMVSVLLDAGAGPDWSYSDGGRVYKRSEGIAMAVFRMFESDVFGPGCVDAGYLSRIASLDEGFQITSSNPIIGLENRVKLLNGLGDSLKAKNARTPSDLIERCHDFSVVSLWNCIHDLLLPIWHNPNGDAWPHTQLGVIPFHKLTMWLIYSLIEPMERLAGRKVTGKELLTGLPEYRNGGFFIDIGVIELRDKSDKSYQVGDDLVIEWRALTVVLLDKLKVSLNTKRNLNLSLMQILEGGTWKAGREFAKNLRPQTGAPPLKIVSDGTVF